MHLNTLIFYSLASIACTYGIDLSALINGSNEVSIAKSVALKFANKELRAKNEECSEQYAWFVRNLMGKTKEEGIWALEMIDASARVPSGVLGPILAWLGSFDQCLNIESAQSQIKGQYCLITIDTEAVMNDNLFQMPNNTNLQMLSVPYLGICVPDKCAGTDIKDAVSSLIAEVPWTVKCQTKETMNAPLDLGAIITVSFFGIFLLLMIISTIQDVRTQDTSERPHPILLAFSVYTNGKKLLSLDKTPNDLACLHGIKFLSMLWVILGHTFMHFQLSPISNISEFAKYFKTTKSMVISNAVHSVDTFFVMTGMLVVYSFMRSKRHGAKFNIFLFYLHRYIRLTPALIPMVLISLFLAKYIGTGPVHPQMDFYVTKSCRDNWWGALLYVQNYVTDFLCVPQTWYLNIDWQLYVLSPIFLLFLPKFPIVGLGIMLCATVGSMSASYMITWDYSLRTLLTEAQVNIRDFSSRYYNLTHTRAATWFVGGFLGYILAKIKVEKNMTYLRTPKWLIFTIWIIVLTAIPLCVFGGNKSLTDEKYHPYSNAFYNAFTRPAWGVCVAWIIFACSIGYGGIINNFLSLPAFQILSRFTYSMYIIHLPMLFMMAFSNFQPVYFTVFNGVYSFFGVLCLSFGLSVFWVLAFESPFIVLEKHFLTGRPKRQSTRTSGLDAKPTIEVKSIS